MAGRGVIPAAIAEAGISALTAWHGSLAAPLQGSSVGLSLLLPCRNPGYTLGRNPMQSQAPSLAQLLPRSEIPSHSRNEMLRKHTESCLIRLKVNRIGSP